MPKVKKLFATYQPLEVAKVLRRGDYSVKENSFKAYDLINNIFSYNPIFAIELTGSIQDFLLGSILVNPTHPQRLIIFESDDYEVLDYLNWNKSIKLGVYMTLDSTYSRKEYIVPKINKSKVKAIVAISERAVGDSNSDYIDYIFKGLDKKLKQVLTKLGYKVTENLKITDFSDLSEHGRYLVNEFITTMYYKPEILNSVDVDNFIMYLKKNVIKVIR
ncbi:hypothetical protein D3C81_10470 [compost metagenome]